MAARDEFIREGYVYKGRWRSKFILECPNGHEFRTLYRGWVNGRRCKECPPDYVYTPVEEEIKDDEGE